MTRFFRLTLLSLIVHVCTAQFDSASVLGTVKDSSGAVIASGKITLENVKTGVARSVQSNEGGNFDFINVPIGTYHVKAEASGFKTSVTEDFEVTVSARQ